jgi:hypothetical protein
MVEAFVNSMYSVRVIQRRNGHHQLSADGLMMSVGDNGRGGAALALRGP